MDGNGQAYPSIIGQAQGVVSVQASCSVDEALTLMQNTADATDETLEYVAGEVVGHRVRFDAPA